MRAYLNEDPGRSAKEVYGEARLEGLVKDTSELERLRQVKRIFAERNRVQDHGTDPLRKVVREKAEGLLAKGSFLPRELVAALERDPKLVPYTDLGTIRDVVWEMIELGEVDVDADLSLTLKRASAADDSSVPKLSSFDEFRYERRHPDLEADERDEGERDRDRLIYAAGLRRLNGVTQVAATDQGASFHNRLTHTLVVAQLARRISEYLRSRSEYREIVSRAGLNPAVAEAAALAHDMGHPPFGHVAETTLNDLMGDRGIVGGFNGNAQSFRRVTYDDTRGVVVPGLNLTRATLNAVLKYPWLSTTQEEKTGEGNEKYAKKWGAYELDAKEFQWVRRDRDESDETPSLEAEIMDWADDVAYALHDVEDFYRVGVLPLDRLMVDETERASFLRSSFIRWSELEGLEGPYCTGVNLLSEVFDRLMDLIRLPDLTAPFDGGEGQKHALRTIRARLTRRYVREPGLALAPDGGPSGCVVVRDEGAERELMLLKELIWHYVIRNPNRGLAAQQVGHKKVIATLFDIFCDAYEDSPHMFPKELRVSAFRRIVEDRPSDFWSARAAADHICLLTEPQAVALYQRVTGQGPGSIVDPITPH